MPRTARASLTAATAIVSLAAASCAVAQEDFTSVYSCQFDAVALCMVVNEHGAGAGGDDACDAGARPVQVAYLPIAMHSGMIEVTDSDGASALVSGGKADMDIFFSWNGAEYALDFTAPQDNAPVAASLLGRRAQGEQTLIEVRTVREENFRTHKKIQNLIANLI